MENRRTEQHRRNTQVQRLREEQTGDGGRQDGKSEREKEDRRGLTNKRCEKTGLGAV